MYLLGMKPLCLLIKRLCNFFYFLLESCRFHYFTHFHQLKVTSSSSTSTTDSTSNKSTRILSIKIVAIQYFNSHAVLVGVTLRKDIKSRITCIIKCRGNNKTIVLLVGGIKENLFDQVTTFKEGIIEASIIIFGLHRLDIDLFTGIPFGSLQGGQQANGMDCRSRC